MELLLEKKNKQWKAKHIRTSRFGTDIFCDGKRHYEVTTSGNIISSGFDDCGCFKELPINKDGGER